LHIRGKPVWCGQCRGSVQSDEELDEELEDEPELLDESDELLLLLLDESELELDVEVVDELDEPRLSFL
jgi:hypothetical protein